MEEGYSKEGAIKAENVSPSSRLPQITWIMRLTGRRLTQAVFQSGRKYVREPMVVYLLKNDLPRMRFAVHARKALGLAVERNHLKRLFREAIRKQAPLFIGYDVILIPRHASRGLRLAQIEQQLHGVIAGSAPLKSGR